MSDIDEKGLSKYQRKQLAKRRGQWETPAAQVAVAVEVKTPTLDQAFAAVERQKNPPPPKEKKPKQPPPPPRGLINDLGNRPEQVSILLAKAADNMSEALAIMTEVLEMSAKGIQQAEPRAIVSFLTVTTNRVQGMATRASLIPNRRGE